jgi:uncharacterized paraquat-inducible protein A
MTSSNGDKGSPNAARQQCVDCRQLAPQTETNYTLISQQHGWRVSRTVDASGRRAMEWRCPRCFAKHRERSLPKR